MKYLKMTYGELIRSWEKILETGDAPVGEHWAIFMVSTKLAKNTLDMLKRLKGETKKLRADIKRQEQQSEESGAVAVYEFVNQLCKGRDTNDPVYIAATAEVKRRYGVK